MATPCKIGCFRAQLVPLVAVCLILFYATGNGLAATAGDENVQDNALPPPPALPADDTQVVTAAAAAPIADLELPTALLLDGDAPWMAPPGAEPPAAPAATNDTVTATSSAATAGAEPPLGPRLSERTKKALRLYYQGKLRGQNEAVAASKAASEAAAAGAISTAAWGTYRQMQVVPIAGSSQGLSVWGFDGLITQAALDQTARVLKTVVESLNDDIRNRLLTFPGFKVALFKRPEQTAFDVPEHSPFRGKIGWEVGGLGASQQVPVSSCDVQNILEVAEDPYYLESVLVHEFSHGIHIVGMAGCEKNAVKAAYSNSKRSGAYTASPVPYIMADEFEYFATASTAWFSSVARVDVTDGVVNRARMWFKDPTLIKLLRYVYKSNVPQFNYRAVCPNCRSKWPAVASMALPNEASAKPPLLSATSLGLDKCGRPVPLMPGECSADANSNCAAWAKRNECTKNPGYMLVSCQASCAVCPDSCTDANTNCWAWAKSGECELNPGYMLSSCRRSCAACQMSSRTGCRDTNVACYASANNGGCSVAATQIACPMSCMRCSKR